MPKKIVVFGAGATGRGHVGLLAWQAGFDMVFVDRDRNLIEMLQNAGQYKVKLYGEQTQEITISPYRAYHSEQRSEIAAEIVDAAVVLTSVFAQNLPDVATTIALAISACHNTGRDKPLNCIACSSS